MKFTPKVGKKDKNKKTKKGTISENIHKKVVKKNVSKEKSNNRAQEVKSLRLDIRNVESKLKYNENIKIDKSAENIKKSITVNTINSKNDIPNHIENNVLIIKPSIKEKKSQVKMLNKKVSYNNETLITSIKSSLHKNAISIVQSNEKTKINKNENKNEKNIKKPVAISKLQSQIVKSKILEQKVPRKSKKVTKLKKKQKMIEIDDDSISEMSDDYIKTREIQDSIEDSSNEEEINYSMKEIVSEKFQDNEDITLIDDIEIMNIDLDKLENKPSNETSEETLIIDNSERILETSDEEIIKNEKEVLKKQEVVDETLKGVCTISSIKKKTSVNENNNANESVDPTRKNELVDSIYDILNKEEFNQSIDTTIYDQPINNNDTEIEDIIQKKSTPKRKDGNPLKKPSDRIYLTPKKQIEIIIISDDEEEKDVNCSEKVKTVTKSIILKGKGDELPVKIKQEVDEIIEQRINKSSQEVIVRAPYERLTRKKVIVQNEQNQEQEQPSLIRKASCIRTTKNGNNNRAQGEENEDTNIENDDNVQRNAEKNENYEQNCHNYEEEKKSKKSKSTKFKMSKTFSKIQKSSKLSKSSKITNDNSTSSESEGNHFEDNEMKIDSTLNSKTSKKRKSISPSKIVSKKKKIYPLEENTSSINEKEHEPNDISSRTIADIIDNYHGTEISTTQKEVYRLAALKRKATLNKKRGILTTPEITTTTVPQKHVNDSQEKKPKVYDPNKNKTAIQMRVVNGEIVIDQQSTMIDHIDTTDEALPMLKYDDSNHITSASFKPKLKPLKWTKDETELFYKCLSIFGTNFSMLAIMFPTRNRKQLLNKYKNEERINPGHVNYALTHKKALDPDFFYKCSGQNMMEIGREAVEKVRLIEEQRKKENIKLFNIDVKENNNVKKVVIKNEYMYDRSDIKDIKPILAT
jgi:hypothetical protein